MGYWAYVSVVLFLIHKLPIGLHTVLIICRRTFLTQQLHVTYDILESRLLSHSEPPMLPYGKSEHDLPYFKMPVASYAAIETAFLVMLV